MDLSQLKRGEQGIVIADAHMYVMKRRLQDLGIVLGTVITCIGASPLGDPIAYSVRNTVIALRVEDAKKIYINEVEDGKSNCICRKS